MYPCVLCATNLSAFHTFKINLTGCKNVQIEAYKLKLDAKISNKHTSNYL